MYLKIVLILSLFTKPKKLKIIHCFTELIMYFEIYYNNNPNIQNQRIETAIQYITQELN